MALGIRQIKIISETNAFIYQVVTARSFGGLRMTEFCEGLSSEAPHHCHPMFGEDPTFSVIPRPPRDLVFLARTSGGHYGANEV